MFMIKLLFTATMLIFYFTGTSQTIDSLKLTGEEVPTGYLRVSELHNKAFHPLTIYNRESFLVDYLGLSNISRKEFQSFKSKRDKGTIFYIEFQEEIQNPEKIGAYLWGAANKPSKMHPEEFLIIEKTLIIWSFALESPLKEISKAKVRKFLK